MSKKLNRLVILSLICMTSSITAFAETKEFFVNAVEIKKVKYWLPAEYHLKSSNSEVPAGAGDYTVKKGDTVIFHLKSKIGGANNIHGFAIDGFKVQALVDDKGLVKSPDNSQVVKFVADKVGTFKIHCHLHPAHVGGNLIVTE